MTPEDLRVTCEPINDESGTGGQTKLARLLGSDPSTICRKLSGKTNIRLADELAIGRAIQKATTEWG